jgi:nucleotide-binding universal stress UspA family protein
LLLGATCAVAIAPTGYYCEGDRDLRALAVGYDGLPESKEALAAAIALAQQAGATLRLLTAADPQAFGGPAVTGYPVASFREDLWDDYQRQLDEALDSISSELRPSGGLVHGDAAAALAAETEKGIDLLFVGSRGYGSLLRVLLGSVSYALIKATPCPLVVVPRGARETDQQVASAGC